MTGAREGVLGYQRLVFGARNLLGMAGIVLSSTGLVLAIELGDPHSSLYPVLLGLWVIAAVVDYYLNHNRFINAGRVRLPLCMLAGVGIGALIVSLVQ